MTAVLGLALLCAGAEGAGAQQPAAAASEAPGMITSRALQPVSGQPAVAVSPYDDSDLNLRLKADFETEIAAQGRGRVESDAEADYLLLFETEVIPADAAPQAPSLGSANVTERGADVSVNVWSSSKDSLLGGRQGSADVGSSVFHINAVLRERGSGRVAWQGDAYHRLAEPETERVARALVAPLVEKIGQSVAHEPLEIR